MDVHEPELIDRSTTLLRKCAGEFNALDALCASH
jgi:hypothetical protein